MNNLLKTAIISGASLLCVCLLFSGCFDFSGKQLEYEYKNGLTLCDLFPEDVKAPVFGIFSFYPTPGSDVKLTLLCGDTRVELTELTLATTTEKLLPLGATITPINNAYTSSEVRLAKSHISLSLRFTPDENAPPFVYVQYYVNQPIKEKIAFIFGDEKTFSLPLTHTEAIELFGKPDRETISRSGLH